MASSSTCNPEWVYDVFVNFRGTLRKKFISHLTDALTRAEINFFIDEKAPKGRELRAELMGAIQGSRIALVVFSKAYAKSHWCLNELVKIMECQTTCGQLVLPIFYHKVAFEKDLEATAKNKYPDEEEQQQVLSKWRTALNQASKLTRLCITNCRDENDLLKKIVGEILKTKANTKLFNTDFPVGLLDSPEQKVTAERDSRGIIAWLEQLLVSVDLQNNMGVDLAPMPSSSLSKLRSVFLQFQLSRTIPDDVNGADFTEIEISSSYAYQISNQSLRSYLIGTESYQEVFNTLRETISEGDSSPHWLTHTSEGRSVFFVVPQNSDGRLKGMALGVYSRSPKNMAAEYLNCVMIVNYTKSTTQIYQQDTVISFNDEDWQGLISSLGPGDRVEIFATFRHKLAIKKTAVFLLYDDVPKEVLDPVEPKENCFKRLFKKVVLCNFWQR